VWSGDYFFDIGTAGATSLVLQTLLLPLALAPGTSSVAIRGGTHVPWSPCFHYLDWHWRPFLARIGVPFDLTMAMAGFYPQGGGELQAQIPGGSRPMPVRLIERGPLRAVRGLSAVANLPREIAERQRRQALRRLRNPLPKVESQVVVEELPAASRGTVLLLLADCAPGRACCFALGAPGKRAERVADEVVDALAALVATVKTAIARGARYLRVHTDCPALVHLWQVRRGDNTMSEVRQAARPLRRLQLRLGPRRFNQVANALARDGVRTPQKGTGHAEHQPEVHPKAGNDPK
jgi:RNA 3'-phosphate cyclase